MLNQEPLVGVLGGVGPLATSRLLRRVIELTDASADQAHANLLVLDHAAIPDRTAYLLGSSAENPAPVLAADAALLLLAALTAGVQALHFASQQLTLIGARHGAVVVFHRVDYSRRRLGHVAVFAAPNAGALCVWLRQRRAAIKAFFKRGAVPAPALGTFQGMILLDSKSETYRYSTPYVKIPARSRYHGQMRAGRANAGRLQRRPGMV